MGAIRFEDLDASISVAPEGRYWVLTCRQTVPTPVEELFPFFADAYNLEEITPAMLNFEVLTPKPIDMKAGALIDYKLRVRGVPIRWKTEIAVWDPPRRFVDQQLKGPYERWHHTHTFEPTPDGGTLCIDRVEYRPIGGPLASVANALFVQRDVMGIFKHRTIKIAERFGVPGRAHAAATVA
jgi:ligand-binding SRPBCC domain-containing protein